MQPDMLRLSIATELYDRTAALHDGRIRPEGIDATWLALNVEQTFWRMLQHAEFDASELSLASYVIRRDQGRTDLTAIPVYLSRTFRHDCIYVNADAGINEPKDLVGRRVGVPEYQITAAVFARGLLADDYEIDPRGLHWVQGGLEEAGRVPHTRVEVPDVEITKAPEGHTLARMLAEGELDALVSPRVPSTFRDGSGRVVRLFADPWSLARDYFSRTRIFPIMHLVVIKSAVVEANPWVPQTLAKAFAAAKRIADANLRETAALPISLPFLVEHAEQTAALMGEDFWPYGVEPNRPTLEAFLRYAHEQGLIRERPRIEDLFPASTQRLSRT
jgi:4,5-dihydroxyphthalate decarboxylase